MYVWIEGIDRDSGCKYHVQKGAGGGGGEGMEQCGEKIEEVRQVQVVT